MIAWTKQDWGDELIVPGERVGGFILRKQPAEFLPQGSSATVADWSGRYNVGIELSETHGVLDISTANPRFHTTEGFKVGGDWNAVVTAWGKPDDVNAMEGTQFFDYKASYRKRGIDFAIKDDKILYIGVFPPEN